MQTNAKSNTEKSLAFIFNLLVKTIKIPLNIKK